jgi:hypothetical protein
MKFKSLFFWVPMACGIWASTVSGFEGPSPQRLDAPGVPKRSLFSNTFGHKSPLPNVAFLPLPFGSIRPRGYLAEQMRLDAQGLAGHLGEMFSDVGDQSGWRGGGGESWERGPYYARGLVALACATGDPLLKAKAKPWVEWAINSQRQDGSFGPLSNGDWWPRMIVMQSLVWWGEATGDSRVLPFLSKALAYQGRMIRDLPLREWARFRGGDNLEPIVWTYDRTGDGALLDLAKTLIAQTYDWGSLFHEGRPLVGGSFVEYRHGVNLAQGLKFPALASLFLGKSLHDPLDGLRFLDATYGQSCGVFTGDETVDDPTGRAGTELCVTVEYLHSLETLLELSGEASVGDRIEKAAFNALPASYKPDYRGYQYYFQPNEVACLNGPHGFPTEHGTNLTFGGVSGYPCCAVNGHYAWPLLSQRLFYGSPEGGLTAALYAPCEVRTQAGGKPVTFREDTQYPFRDRITLTFSASTATSFPLRLRIPAWCSNAHITVNGQDESHPTAGTFFKIDRTWKTGDRVVLEFPMKILVSERENHSVSVERGPLVYSLAVREKWRPIAHHPELSGPVAKLFPSYEVLPESAWNLALVLDQSDLSHSLEVIERKVQSTQPFSPQGAPIELLGQARKIPSWTLNEWGLAGVPPYPAQVEGPSLPVTLLPFGSTRLRVTYLPTIDK